MKIISDLQLDLIDAVLAERASGGLTAAIIEKDIHVTDALHALFALEHAHFHFVFCGGTSLSKAHGIIERMSEDVDLKIVLPDSHSMSRNALKTALSKLKYELIAVMSGLGFEEDATSRKALNENSFLATTWHYASRYASDTSSRAHLRLEFTLCTPKFQTIPVPIGYLVDTLANRPGKRISISCIAIEETLAEKVLSFLRRFSLHRFGKMTQDWDTALVRHIYDTYCIVQKTLMRSKEPSFTLPNSSTWMQKNSDTILPLLKIRRCASQRL